MSFLYPLFLLSALAVAIPILIHLFNLRRYKTVLFPHTRFLKNIHLRSQKQSQIRYKWLLAARILFLLLLVLAFAQPFSQNDRKLRADAGLQVIYLDNSASMSVKKGARSLLEISKENIRRQLLQAPLASKFLILTNDKPVSYQPVPIEKALATLSNIDITSSSKNVSQVLASVQGLMQSEALQHANVYYYADFQKSVFPASPDSKSLANIDFYGMPVRAAAPANVYIDTAILASPVLQSGQNNKLIVTSRSTGKTPSENPIIQLFINGQVKSAASLHFDEKQQSIDTLSFQTNEAGWQQMSLVINDAIRFDDTFRIAARSNTNLSILVLNENQPNPFIQAAFRSYNGFRMDTRQLSEEVDWKQYNLIILNGVTRLSEDMATKIGKALEQGQSITIFPGKTSDIASLNAGLSKIAPIQILGIDTSVQNATSLQQGADLVKDIFESIPANVQLPQANWHYKINSGLSANQQSVISFRNGDPLLAQYAISGGKLYFLSSTADLQSGSFPGSYFFAPFLYQMTTQSKVGNVFATTIGTDQPVFMSFQHTGERNMVHLYAGSNDIIPPQQPRGVGLDVYAGKALQHAGFYILTAPGNDTVQLAMNEDRRESQLELWDLASLKEHWNGENVKWATENETNSVMQDKGSSFPLWKVCAILALIMLVGETYLLVGNYRKTRIAKI